MIVNSFDIFDTLIARNVISPIDIFDIVGTKLQMHDFKTKRIMAQSQSNQTYDNIYEKLQIILKCNNEYLNYIKELEFQTELENTIPIMSNIIKINDGDIVVSDMYLNESYIRRLLLYHNINKNIKIYVSPDGKSSGYMWSHLLSIYEIKLHIGDNMHSDIKMANRYNINSNITNIYKFTYLEQLLLNYNRNISHIFRKFRLQNPYEEDSLLYKYYEEQINYNIPILLVLSFNIKKILETENRNIVLFITRDGCHLKKFFNKLFPEYTTKDLHSSRIINQNYSQDYINYLLSIYDDNNCIIYDNHGGFQSGYELYIKIFGKLPRSYFLSLILNENNMKYINSLSYLTLSLTNHYEFYNVDLKGTLVDFINNKDIRRPLEYKYSLIKLQHDIIDSFLDNNDISIFDCDLFKSNNIWIDYLTKYAKFNIPIIKNIYGNNGDSYNLTEIANKYNSDKGSTFACAHNYTIVYQVIIDDILKNLNYDNSNFNLLEIGLNRVNTENIPSLLMWNEYFNNNINITGFDIQKNFLKFNNIYNNINIVCGDQSNIDDLNKLKNKKYNIIIDDGLHASKHQQISFKTLWNNVLSKGYYIIEDLHYQPYIETCTSTKELLIQWSKKNYISSEYINIDEVKEIISTIENIYFSDSLSNNPNFTKDSLKNAFVYIKKI
jgi:hypothetical protein